MDGKWSELNTRLAKNGVRTVYVEHGVWYDPGTKHIHVTCGSGHWSYARTHPRYALYQELLASHGRWPGDAPMPEA